VELFLSSAKLGGGADCKMPGYDSDPSGSATTINQEDRSMGRGAGGLEPPLPAASAPPVRDGGRSTTLRFRLFLLAASGLVPLALVLVLSSIYLAQQRQDQTQRAAFELSVALATAVDAELRSTFSLLENLAIAAELDTLEPAQLAGDSFAPLAKRVLAAQGWRSIIVANARGEVIRRAPAGGDPTRGPVEPASMARVLASRSAAVGQIARGARGQDAFAVRIPVFRDEQLRYVLSAAVSTDKVLEVVARQRLAPGWVVAVYDQEGNRVARSLATTSPRYSPSLEALVRSGGQQGMGRTVTLEGVQSHTGFSRVRSSQWVVAVGIPASEANRDLYRLLGAVGAGTVASLGLLAWLAWRMTGGISGPIDRLKQAASALGAGQQVELPALGVQELDEVAHALRRAGSERDDANARRSRVEAEREDLLRRLEEALRVAEQANRNKDQFLALLGHELRNPLAPIMNAVHLMDLKGDERTAGERGIIQRQLAYVTRLVDDLLDASRITSNRFVINRRPLRPVPVLEQTIESVRLLVGERRLTLRIDPATRTLWTLADEARLVQVFNNLLGNSIKFTQPSGAIDIAVARRGDAIEFKFRDDGAGMARDDLKRAFDLFYQAPNSARGVSGGLGLGLAIVKSLVEMHSGSIRMHSDGPGQGTTVTLRLPLTQPVSEDPTIPRALPVSLKTRVLVVDDNADAADTLGTVLSLSGFVVRVVYTPEAALEAMPGFAPEVAVLDIGLPGMDGYELAQRLRSGPPAFQGKLIALTGYGQEQDVKKAMSAGFDAHLTKPIEPQVLLRLIADLLERTT
jgi:signal transduction histidine kinase